VIEVCFLSWFCINIYQVEGREINHWSSYKVRLELWRFHLFSRHNWNYLVAEIPQCNTWLTHVHTGNCENVSRTFYSRRARNLCYFSYRLLLMIYIVCYEVYWFLIDASNPEIIGYLESNFLYCVATRRRICLLIMRTWCCHNWLNPLNHSNLHA
jgi:hypothetical protein